MKFLRFLVSLIPMLLKIYNIAVDVITFVDKVTDDIRKTDGATTNEELIESLKSDLQDAFGVDDLNTYMTLHVSDAENLLSWGIIEKLRDENSECVSVSRSEIKWLFTMTLIEFKLYELNNPKITSFLKFHKNLMTDTISFVVETRLLMMQLMK